MQGPGFKSSPCSLFRVVLGAFKTCVGPRVLISKKKIFLAKVIESHYVLSTLLSIFYELLMQFLQAGAEPRGPRGSHHQYHQHHRHHHQHHHHLCPGCTAGFHSMLPIWRPGSQNSKASTQLLTILHASCLVPVEAP